MKVPDLIAKAHLALPWDERDQYWEVMLTPNMAWTNTHIDKGDRGDVLVRIGGTAEGCPVVKIYDAPMNPQRTLDCFPPTGQPVWMIKGRKFDIVRTMRTSAPGSDGTFHFVTAVGDGPHPGQPQQGDSGSVCWTVINGVAKIVGLVVSARQISLPFWTRTLTGSAEGLPQFVVPPRYRPQQPDQLPAMDFSFDLSLAAVTPEPSETQQPQPQPQPMNRHTIIIRNAVALIRSVVITGINGDRWERPTNPAGYWPVDNVETSEGFVLSWDVSQTQGANYTVMLVFANGSSVMKSGVATGDVIDLKPMVSTGAQTPQPPQPITPDTEMELKAQIARMEQLLSEQHSRVSMLTAELERLNDIKNSIDRLGKAMGWSR